MVLKYIIGVSLKLIFINILHLVSADSEGNGKVEEQTETKAVKEAIELSRSAVVVNVRSGENVIAYYDAVDKGRISG